MLIIRAKKTLSLAVSAANRRAPAYAAVQGAHSSVAPATGSKAGRAEALPRASVYSPAAPPRVFNWDNWVTEIGPLHAERPPCLARFTLEAPWDRDVDSRHEKAHIALHLPGRDGTFTKLCTVIDQAPAWSGSALNLTNLSREADIGALSGSAVGTPIDREPFSPGVLAAAETSAIALAYTSRARGFEHFSSAPQAISLAYKPAGALSFFNHGEVLNPFAHECENLHLYKVDDSNHVVSAWRDPFVFFAEGHYHMLFAARYSEAFFHQMPQSLRSKHEEDASHHLPSRGYNPDVCSAVGYARSEDLKGWQLQAPLHLAANASQFELPSVTQVGRDWVLSVLVANGSVAGDDGGHAEALFGPRRQYPLVFRSRGGLASIGHSDAWRSLENQINSATHSLTASYGLNCKAIGDRVYATAFDGQALRFSPVVSLERKDFPLNLPNEADRRWSLMSSDTSSATAAVIAA